MQEANIIFETAKMLNFINAYDTEILKILLNSQQEKLFFTYTETNKISALDYVILEKNKAIDPKIVIPTAFLTYDFNQNIDVRKKLIAGEKLTKIGAISDTQLFQLYKNDIIEDNFEDELKNRIAFIKSLEKSIIAKDPVQIRKFLSEGFSIFDKVGLSTQFSEHYSAHILNQQNLGWDTPISIKMSLLTGNYSDMKNSISLNSNFILAQSVAKNDYSKLRNISSFEENIISAIRDPIYNEKNTNLIDQGKTGEVILSSILLLTDDNKKNAKNIKNGLRGLMQTGLEKIAKLIVIQYILMD